MSELVDGARAADAVQEEVAAWASVTFPNATAHSIAAHLLSEAVELYHSVGGTSLGAAEIVAAGFGKKIGTPSQEAGDIQMLLYHLGGFLHFSVMRETLRKLVINRSRTWKKANSSGFFEHDTEGK